MEVSYKFTPKEIKKISKFKNPSIILRKENIVKNGKYKIHLTKNMFNKLLEEKQLKYVFTDKRKEYYIREGGSLASIFKTLSPHLIKFGKKLLPALGITTASTLTSHGISKALNKKKGGSILKVNLSQSDVNKINNMLNKLPAVIKKQLNLSKFKNINQQNGGSILGTIAMLAASILPSLISGKGYCEKDNFFEKINNKDLYPISNFKINEILKNDKNYIGTFSKNNVPKLKNHQSTIVNLANSNDKGSHWIGMKYVDKKLFYFDSYGIPYIPDIIKNQYSDNKIITNIYRIQSNDSNECGKFCIMFIQSNIKNESDYIKFLLQFEKNYFEKNDI